MIWLQEEIKAKAEREERKFVRFAKGKGNNKNATHLYISKSLFNEADEKGYKYVRLGVAEIGGKKVLGFNFNKTYGGMELKNKNGGWRKVFNVNAFLKAYQAHGIELPLNTQLDVVKEGHNYIHYL